MWIEPMLIEYRTILRRSVTAVIGSLAVVALTYCSAINVFPVSEDQKLGAQFDADIKKDPKTYPLSTNAGAKLYLQNIVNTLIKAPEVEYDGRFPYKVEIISDDKTVNAFCTPGGYIYVYTGLIKMLDNEAAIAGVLGHEIAHAERRHSTSRMTKQLGVQTLMGIVLQDNSNQNIDLAANAIAGLGLLKNSRNDEDEADEYSFMYLKSTNTWYPGGIMYFFDAVRGRGGGALGELLSTHPLAENRLANTIQRLKDNNVPPPTELNLRSRQYAEFKRKL
jgi:beta-barrel assembly-enhancing protease